MTNGGTDIHLNAKVILETARKLIRNPFTGVIKACLYN